MVEKGTCSEEGCFRVVKARTLCGLHYERHLRSGQPWPMADGRTIKASTLERLFRYTTITESGCWEWCGATDKDGYGFISIGSKATGANRPYRVHRVGYELMVGPIPDGLEIDHLCFNRACWCPDHLEPVTTLENVRRQRRWANRTTCDNGHPVTEENTYVYPDGLHRRCRICRREWEWEREQNRVK